MCSKKPSSKQIINKALLKEEACKKHSIPSYIELNAIRNHQIALEYLALVSDHTKKKISQKKFCQKYNISHNTLRKNLIHLTGRSVQSNTGIHYDIHKDVRYAGLPLFNNPDRPYVGAPKPKKTQQDPISAPKTQLNKNIKKNKNTDKNIENKTGGGHSEDNIVENKYKPGSSAAFLSHNEIDGTG